MRIRTRRWKVVRTEYLEEMLNELQKSDWTIYQIDLDPRGGPTVVIVWKWVEGV